MNVNESLRLSEKDKRNKRYSTHNSHRLNPSSCSYSQAVKQTTCTTAVTSSTAVYKCRQCNRLFVSLTSVQEHRLTVHTDRSDLIGFRLCGTMYQANDKIEEDESEDKREHIE